MLIVADVICAARRIRFGHLPPLGFIAMREHLNYFTTESPTALLARNGFQVATCGIDNGGQLFAVARKFATTGARSRNTAAIAA